MWCVFIEVLMQVLQGISFCIFAYFLFFVQDLVIYSLRSSDFVKNSFFTF